MTRDGREVVPGVDRAFSPTPPPACGDVPATPAAHVAPFRVTGHEFRFEPDEVRVAAGQPVTVAFANAGHIPHTLTLPVARVDTGSVAAGDTATLAFTAPAVAGRYEFLCSFGGHPEAGMVGTLIVE